MNYKIKISYDGTNYAGWQIQPKKKTIQGEIEFSLHKIFNEKINIIGSGRTDAGVHAHNQVANFHIDTNISPDKIKQAINSNLKDDIFIKSCKIVDNDFHSRFSAIEREYEYNISENADYAEDLVRMGFRVTPVTVIGTDMIAGFAPGKLEKALSK